MPSKPVCSDNKRAASADGGVVVHFGVGNFHRAHQSWHLARVNRRAKSDWQIVGVCPRRARARDLLRRQNMRYHLLIEGGDGARLERIDIHRDIVVAPENPTAVANAVAAPRATMATFTITEDGYSLAAAKSDPASVFHLLAAGLDARRRAGGGGITLLSCDNLPENGRALRRALFAACETFPGLAEWIDKRCAFPSSMVDRIVPQTEDCLRLRLRSEFDIDEEWPAQTEEFSQWVVENRFAAARPALELGSVEIVADARPHENAKLRMLNGAHSFLAYAGLLRGFCFMREAAIDAALGAELESFWDEIETVTAEPPNWRWRDYRRSLAKRFAAPAPAHRLRQIAADGSRKIPARWLPPMRARLEAGLPAPAIGEALAVWAAFCVREARQGATLLDPLAADLTRAAAEGPARLLETRAIFGGIFDGRSELAADIARRAGAYLQNATT